MGRGQRSSSGQAAETGIASPGSVGNRDQDLASFAHGRILGCILDTDVITGAISDYDSIPFDNAAVINAFLATASQTNPVKLILDGGVSVSGLIVSPNGYTTIEGIGWGSGLFVINGSRNQNAISVGVAPGLMTTRWLGTTTSPDHPARSRT